MRAQRNSRCCKTKCRRLTNLPRPIRPQRLETAIQALRQLHPEVPGQVRCPLRVCSDLPPSSRSHHHCHCLRVHLKTLNRPCVPFLPRLLVGWGGGAPSSPASLNSLTPPSSPTVATQFKGQSAQGVADAKALRCREQAGEAPRDPILRLYWKMAAVLDSASGAGSIALGVGAGAGATVGSGTSASVSSPLTRMSPASNAQRPATPTCPQVRRLPPQTEERGCQCSYIAWTA